MKNETITDSAGRKYIVQNELGRGGFGIVYLAQNSNSELFAIKFMGPISELEVAESFKREIQVATKPHHKNLLQFVGEGNHMYNGKGYFFTITEYCPDGNYKKLMKERPFALETIILEFKQILTGLGELHKYVVHRDIKPENILKAGDYLKVADLGLSKSIDEATKTLTFKGSGTPNYMAPEIWERGKITPATDFYALGIMLFEAITGEVPFRASDLIQLRDMHLYNPAPRVKLINKEIPDHIDGIIKKLLEKDSAKRYQNAQEIITALESVPHSPVVLSSAPALRDRIRQSHDRMESQRLDSARIANKAKENSKKIEYMEQQLISQFSDAIDEINQGLHETQITKAINHDNARYSFLNRTLTISFFHQNALYENNTLPALQEELKRHFAIHAGAIFIKENGENREGWNVVLIRPNNESYGEWILIESDISVLTGKSLKYPPAATDKNLLSENLAYHWMNTMHIWTLKDKVLESTDIEHILNKFIP